MIEFDTRANGAVPFWFWNGDQQEDEITRQLELAAAGGLKGMAVHARRGNQTEYLSERWFALMRHTCEEARRLGLAVWLYDEEGFPSGTVGHRLQENNPFYQQKRLCYGYLQGNQLGDLDNLVAAYDAATYKRVVSDKVDPNRELLAFHMACLPRYVDALKRETVERFLEMTHDVYFEELRDYFGNPITHIYTDDLTSYLDRGPSLPWTEKLPHFFDERTDYQLLDCLPALIENIPGCEKVRLDFRGLVLDLFLHEFVDPMVHWCERHGVVLTGHLNGDEGEMEKAVQRFGSAMAFYEREPVPGIDDFLCSVASGCYLDQLRNEQNHCPVILFKQASSVANQFKSGACSCEVLTFLGWGASLWGQSAFLNYELALGVNQMIHHAFSYATGGVAKRDCPPSYFFQQPYWPHYQHFYDAVSRSIQLLKRGSYDAQTLVIHPMSSCWTAIDGSGCSIGRAFETRTPAMHPAPGAMEESLAAISHELLKLHVGFEYGDEWLLAKHAAVREGELQVGAMAYNTIIIPQVSNLLESTVALLEAFQAGGGRLLAVQPDPKCRVDGEISTKQIFFERLSPLVLDSPETLRACDLQPSLDLYTDEADAPVICHTRRINDRGEHFIVNVSDRAQCIHWDDDLVAYDPVGHECLVNGGDSLTLPPFHAVHLLPDAPAEVNHTLLDHTLFRNTSMESMRVVPNSVWTITREEANLMLIDWCECPGGKMAYFTERIDSDAVTLAVTLEITDPGRVTSLLGEAVTLKGLTINGTPLSRSVGRHPSSPDLEVADIKGLLLRGHNRITFERLVGEVLFEPFYLMGDFGVELVDTQAGMRPALTESHYALGDLVELGLPFYWGGVRYEATIQNPVGAEWLDCGEVDGVITLSVNGVDAGCRYTAPYRFHIANLLTRETNTLMITLNNTAQNLYGPHRGNYGVALHPCPRRGHGQGDYTLAAFGLYGPVTILTG